MLRIPRPLRSASASCVSPAFNRVSRSRVPKLASVTAASLVRESETRKRKSRLMLPIRVFGA